MVLRNPQPASRSRTRMLLADGALAVPLGLIMVVGTFGAAMNPNQVPAPRPLDALTFVFVGLAIAALPARRVLPLSALAVIVAATSAYIALRYPFGPILFAVAVGVYTVASRYPVRRSLPAWALTAVALAVPVTAVQFEWQRWLVELSLLGVFTTAFLAPWAVGTAVRLRRESVQAARTERARDRAYQERLRTAQDVHDIVGHGLAAISMQAGVALHVLDRSPERAREMLASIKATSQDALDELRATLAVFRAPADGAERAPTPGLDQLDGLVNRTIEAGLPVELVRTGEQGHLPASVEMTAYRIVQESLTNVLRHAGPATATVRVEHAAAELLVEVTDTGDGPAETTDAGQGITGMRARAAAVGGTLEAGPGRDGGFAVRARLPVELR
ncbi:MAG: sensor histidine kinase [Pseudonocardiaceae bacterium]|nr:sensor histidine kinase [Pseudonocardiaceae bacterium]